MNPISEALIQDFYTHLRSNNISAAKAVLSMLIGIAAATSQTEKPAVFYAAMQAITHTEHPGVLTRTMDDIQRRLRSADLERRTIAEERTALTAVGEGF
jgi:hypothetical protein